jgi:excisionase family DNA binding protein
MQKVNSDFLTRRQVAAIFQVSQPTVIRWELAGRFPAVRLGAGSVRYRRADVEAFIQSCAAKTV